jgi:hypothetical protein
MDLSIFLALELSGPQLTNSELDEFEQEVLFRMPLSYRRFLLKYNGGFVFNRLHFPGNDAVLPISNFYPLEKDHGLRVNYRQIRIYDLYPEGLMPIGSFSGDTSIGLFDDRLGGRVVSTKYVYDMFEQPCELKVVELADSFAEFVSRLRIAPERHEPE